MSRSADRPESLRRVRTPHVPSLGNVRERGGALIEPGTAAPVFRWRASAKSCFVGLRVPCLCADPPYISSTNAPSPVYTPSWRRVLKEHTGPRRSKYTQAAVPRLLHPTLPKNVPCSPPHLYHPDANVNRTGTAPRRVSVTISWCRLACVVTMDEAIYRKLSLRVAARARLAVLPSTPASSYRNPNTEQNPIPCFFNPHL